MTVVGTAPGTSARRLALTVEELEVLRRRSAPVGAGLALPPGFVPAPAAPADPCSRAKLSSAARASLAARGLVDVAAPGDAHPALVRSLRALAAPGVGVLLAARRPDVAVTAALALDAATVVVLVRLDAVSVELSLAPAADLRHELGRLVPAPTCPASELAPGSVPLGAMAATGSAEADPSRPPRRDPASAVDVLDESFSGALLATVVRAGTGPVGSVLWLATRAGWLDAGPVTDQGGVRAVEMVPCDVADLGRRLAPLVALAAT